MTTVTDSLAPTQAEQYAISRIEQATAMLAEVESAPEVKDIRDKAEAIRLYLRQQAGSLRSQNHAAALKLRAERKLGEMLAETVQPHRFHRETSVTLDSLAINKTASHRWQTIARLPAAEFEAYVGQADTTEKELTSAELYRIAKREIVAAKTSEGKPIPEGCYSVIEADPPWALDCNEAYSGISHYDVADLDDIKALGDKVLARAADDCTLWLWVINPMLPEGVDVMAAWGFAYKSCLTWVKTNGFGTGHYLRGATEHVLLGVRGAPELLRRDQRTYFEAKRGRHSEKPDEFYSIVESLTSGPRLRLFARGEREGWDSWGDQL